MKRITVLLADNNKLVRREFRKILELESDLEVVGEAKDGHEAVTLAKKLRPSLVLMDVTMPLLNGRKRHAEHLLDRATTAADS
jgi:YesN/AraC family two-component response regulator